MSSSTARPQLRSGALTAVLTVALLTACAAHEMPPPMPLPMPPQAPPPETPTTVPEPRPQDVLAFSPRWGALGAPIQLTAGGFAPNARVEVGFALPGEVPRALGAFTTDERGMLAATVHVPDWAQSGRVYSFFAGAPGEQPRLIADGFHIAEPDGAVRVEGALTDEGVECPALRTADGRLYTLTGELGDFGAGDRVIVHGTLPEMSICMQGTTVEIRTVRRADG